MAEELRQKLGFDVSDALRNLDRLDKKLAQASAGIERFGNVLNQFNRGNTAIEKFGRQAEVSLGRAEQSIQKVSFSWQGLVERVIVVQTIVKAMRRLETAFVDAGKRAIDFQKSIAEIQTIANGSLGNLSALSEEVRRISDAFAIPIDQSAAGLYETIGNQIGEGAENIEFLESAARFSVGSVSSLQDSVNLLSGTLNAFNLGVEQTDEVAGKFFKTIDLGRSTASELATAFGRVAAPAAQLGVSFEEIAAGFATITVRGVKTAETATQLRGILTALAKPTDAMQEAFARLGFSTAEQAIQTRGLGGVLTDLAAQTNGTTEELAKLFPNVRGLSGALALGTQASETFTANLKEIQNTTAELNQQKFELVANVDGSRISKEINKIRNATTDLGESLLRASVSASDFVGGADNVVRVAKVAGPAILGVGSALAIYTIQSRNATLQTGLLGAAVSKLNLALAGVGIASSVGSFIGRSIDEQLSEATRAIEKAGEESLKRIAKQEAERLKLAEDTDAQRVRSAFAAAQEITKAYNDQVNLLSGANQRLVDGVEKTLDRIVSARERLLREIVRAQSRIGSLKINIDDRNFERQLAGLSEIEKVARLTERSRQLAAEAAGDLSRAASGADIRDALQQFARAEQLGETAADIAERTENRVLELNAAQSLNRITEQQIAAEKRLTELQKDRQSELAAEQERQEAIVNRIREQAQILLDNVSQVDKAGKLLTPDQLAQQAAKRQEALAQILRDAVSQEDLNVADALGLAKIASELQAGLQDPIELRFQVESGIRDIQTRMQSAFREFRLAVPFDVGQLERLLGRAVSNPTQVFQGITEIQNEANRLRRELAEAPQAEREIEQIRKFIDAVGAEAATSKRLTQRLFGDPLQIVSGFQVAIDDVRALREGLDRLSESSNITDADLQKLLARLSRLNDFAFAGLDNAGIKKDVEQFSEALLKLQRLQQLQKVEADPADEQRLQQIERFLRAADSGKSFERASQALGSAVPHSANIANQMERAANAAERAARAAAQIQPPSIGGLATGGLARFADGGLNRGIDVRPAMLARDEFVINPTSTRKFFPQIQAINAGINPLFRSEGGNTTIGDIHVNVSGGETGHQTAREIASGLRRALRRRAIRI